MPGRFPDIHGHGFNPGPYRFDLSESTSHDLTLGDIMDFMGIANARNIRLDYGESSNGLRALRDAVGRRSSVPADWIVTTQGANFALYLVASELGKQDDSAIITAPYFQQAYSTLTANGWRVHVVQNHFEQNYRLNVEGITDALARDTRLVSIASPQNPGGISTPLATIKRLLDVMKERSPNAFLLVDETYREAAYSATGILPSAASLSTKVITCSSISKAYGTPGLRAGWMTLPDENLRQTMISAKENILITDSVLTEQLATVVLDNADSVLEKQRALLVPALKRVARWQSDQRHQLDWLPPDAGALCCMRLSHQRFDDSVLPRFWQALAELDTFVRPGVMFGSDLRHFRLGFGHLSLDALEAGLENISTALASI